MSAFDWLPWVRARQTRELADEMRAHLEHAQADFIARGESPREAALHARREFGNVELVRETARDEWSRGGAWLEAFGHDVRFSLRMMRKSWGFTTVAALTIAFGVGATTAIFGVVDATLLRSLPYPHAEQLVRIQDDLLGSGASDVGMSTPEWHDLERSGAFEQVSPVWFDDNNLTGGGLTRAQHVGLSIVAPNYFALLGVKPQLGTTFDPADHTGGFNGQAVISDAVWTRLFGRDPSALGRIVQLDSDSYRIIGIMPPTFEAPGRSREERSTEVWVAMGFAGPPLTNYTRSGTHFPGVLARVERGVSLAEAQSRIDALVHTLRAQYPKDYPPRAEWTLRIVPLKDIVVGNVRQSLLFLFGAVSLVLLIGCANVANLLLARASSRSRELAVREAIGASTGRLIAQLLTESVAISVLGGLVGLVILFIARAEIRSLVPAELPRASEIGIGWATFSFAFGVSIAAGVVFGLASALFVRRLDVNRTLKQEGRASTASREQARTRRFLVVGQIALSTVLLVAAGLLVRSFMQLTRAPLGFDAHGVTVVRTRLPYPNEDKEDLYPTPAAEAPFVREVRRRVLTLPGVEAAALGASASIPLDHPEQDQNVMSVIVEGHAGEPPALVTGAVVSPEYFDVLHLPLRSGRLFTDFDRDKSPLVAVVNESMAERFWPHESALGKRIKLSPGALVWATVVGIVADARTEAIETAREPVLYASLYQRSAKHLAIFLRGRSVDESIADAVRGEVQSVNQALPVFGAESLERVVADSLAARRFVLRMMALFALTALVLAGLGLYGVVSHAVAERTHEIGLRVALGAQGGDVTRLVLRQGMKLCATGAVLGLVGAAGLAYEMSSRLYGVRAADPLSFGVVTAVMFFIAGVACYLPLRRAVRVDPLTALRS
ncbi:MAG TPA: ABC transporter permease [Gemmatimonadaceae bacterium]|nr:ABC transporter permease [Gemmatimonadaceae bacterium]